MNLNDTDLNLFIAFDVIYKEKNLTKAGEVLGITQPAVSNALSRLRALFDDELFVRTSKGMVPTAVAQNISEDIKEGLKLFRNTISDSSTFTPKTSRTTFKISMGDTSSYRLLPKLFKSLGKKAPEIDFISYLTPRRDTPRELAAGNIDFSIDPPIHTESALKHSKLFEDKYVVMVRKDHPIASKRKITLDDYLSLSHILISERRTGMGHVDISLFKLGLTRRIALRAQHLLLAPHILETTDLALTSTKSFAKSNNLKTFELPFQVDPLVLHLYWHETKENDSGNKWIRELILKSYG
ncbi:MAG: LysR family transcriptional regulator [Gammaproteobacteria bacterium]